MAGTSQVLLSYDETLSRYALREAFQQVPHGQCSCCWIELAGVTVVQKRTRSLHMSFIYLVRLDLFLPSSLAVLKGLVVLGTLKHAQIAAIKGFGRRSRA